MVIQKSVIFRMLTGFHGGLRRGAAAALLGAVLVFVAGTPASNAVVAVPTTQSSMIQSESPIPTTDSSDTELPADAKGTPAPPSSQEPKRGKPDTAPAVTAVPSPPTAELSAPDPKDAAPAPAPEATSFPPTSATKPNPGPSYQTPAYGEVQAQSSTGEEPRMKQVSKVDPAEASRLLWWGVALVLFSGIAAVIFLRLRKA
jgi:hypothetical protein